MKKQSQSPQSLSDIFAGLTQNIKRLGALYIEKARLKTTEKLTIMLSTIAFTGVVVAVALILLVFITIGFGHWLATSIAPHLAYLIMAGFYLILLVLIVLMRKKWFINPIARFMSRLLVEAPDDENQEGETVSENEIQEVGNDDEPEIDYDKLARHIVKVLDEKADKPEIQEKEGGEL